MPREGRDREGPAAIVSRPRVGVKVGRVAPRRALRCSDTCAAWSSGDGDLRAGAVIETPRLTPRPGRCGVGIGTCLWSTPPHGARAHVRACDLACIDAAWWAGSRSEVAYAGGSVDDDARLPLEQAASLAAELARRDSAAAQSRGIALLWTRWRGHAVARRIRRRGSAGIHGYAVESWLLRNRLVGVR